MNEYQIKILDKFKNNDWYNILKGYLLSEDFLKVLETLKKEVDDNKLFTPPLSKVFKTFEITDPNKLKVVILGQDPYPRINVADGLAFSCSGQTKPQPSLRFLQNAINKTVYSYSVDPGEFQMDLSYLCEQGVLLLNTSLTTQIDKIGSHLKLWKPFTNYVIDMLNSKNLIWIFLGSKAYEFEELVNSPYKLFATHPAAGVYSGNEWECNDIFNATNTILKEKNLDPIVW